MTIDFLLRRQIYGKISKFKKNINIKIKLQVIFSIVMLIFQKNNS